MELVTLFCCEMKPHNFFYLMNLFTQGVVACLMYSLYVMLYFFNPIQRIFTILHYFCTFSVTAFMVLCVIAFFFYVFSDDFQTSYHRFFVNYQIVFCISILVCLFIALISNNLYPNTYTTIYFDAECIFFIVSFSFILGLSFKLRDAIYDKALNSEDEFYKASNKSMPLNDEENNEGSTLQKSKEQIKKELE